VDQNIEDSILQELQAADHIISIAKIVS